MLDETPKLLKVGEVAQRLRVSPWTVYRLVASGQLPAIKLGGGTRAPLRIAEGELERWLTS